MNTKMVLKTVGQILVLEAGLFVLPGAVAVYYREWGCLFSFLLSIAVAVAVGGGLALFVRPKNRVIYAKEGFVLVALAWLALSAVGALPFVISREIPSYVDAFFETVSGFTTTGASILNDVEAMSKSLLFWRSFTHWIGGMGILVFVMALMPSMSDRPIHIMRAEMPGPIVGKFVPKAKDTAKILYLIYIALTLAEAVMLLAGGMSTFEALVHTFATAGTGGFGILSDSVASYSPYIQWVITIFMVIFGINFNLFYLIFARKARAAFHSAELWTYFAIVVGSVTAITVNIYPIYQNLEQAIRLSAFQFASIISTTGFATANFDTWPDFSKAILLLAMFIGACAGSTAGGLKVSRVVLTVKMVKRELQRLLHSRSVGVIRFEGKQVDEATLNSVSSYLAVYLLCFVLIFLLLCLEPFGFTTNFSAAASCFNNIGPGFGAVGPASSYACYSVGSKLVLSVAMLLGRLEILPLLVLVSPSTWSKKRF